MNYLIDIMICVRNFSITKVYLICLHLFLSTDFSIAEDNRSSSPMSQREGNSHLISRREGYLTPNHFARSASLGVAGRTPINPMQSNPSSSTGRFYSKNILDIFLH